jgi:predicted NBD/HSP70 family sugar kinase
VRAATLAAPIHEEPTVDTPASLRETGRLRVLQALHERGRSSRTELVRLTGLSRTTVSALVADALANGLVQEEQTGPAETPVTGRPAQPLSLNPAAAYAVGADIGHQHVRVVLCDLSGAPVWETTTAIEVDRSPHETLDLTAALIARGLAEHGTGRDRVLGLGAGIAAPVDKSTGTLGTDGIMPGWAGLRPASELADRTGLPTTLVNDANAGSLAEWRYGAARGVEDMIYIRLSAGIGAGLVTDGRALLGARGLVGEVGHLCVDPNGWICRCGNRGCLETVASPVAIARLLTGSWGRPVTPADLPRLVTDGAVGVLRAIEDAGSAVGTVLAELVTVLNPELVVVGGDLAALGEPLFAPLRAALHRHALPSASSGLTVVPGELGERAEALGAAGLVLATAPQHLVAIG